MSQHTLAKYLGLLYQAFLDFHFFTPEPSNVDLYHDKFYIIMKLSDEIMRCDLTQMKAIKQYFTMLLGIMLENSNEHY